MLNEEELDTKETSVENNNSETKKKDLGEKQWYVVSTYTGREKQVAESLERRSVNLNLKDYILESLSPNTKKMEKIRMESLMERKS